MAQLVGKAVVAQGGGPTAVINQTLAGVALEAAKHPQITRLYGAVHGVRGVLNEEFLAPLGITQYRLAKEIGVPQRRIGEIVAGTRAITPDTGLRLSRFFAMSDGFWIGLQADYDREKARAALAKTLARIKPWPEAAKACTSVACAYQELCGALLAWTLPTQRTPRTTAIPPVNVKLTPAASGES